MKDRQKDPLSAVVPKKVQVINKKTTKTARKAKIEEAPKAGTLFKSPHPMSLPFNGLNYQNYPIMHLSETAKAKGDKILALYKSIKPELDAINQKLKENPERFYGENEERYKLLEKKNQLIAGIHPEAKQLRQELDDLQALAFPKKILKKNYTSVSDEMQASLGWIAKDLMDLEAKFSKGGYQNNPEFLAKLESLKTIKNEMEVLINTAGTADSSKMNAESYAALMLASLEIREMHTSYMAVRDELVEISVAVDQRDTLTERQEKRDQIEIKMQDSYQQLQNIYTVFQLRGGLYAKTPTYQALSQQIIGEDGHFSIHFTGLTNFRDKRKKLSDKIKNIRTILSDKQTASKTDYEATIAKIDRFMPFFIDSRDEKWISDMEQFRNRLQLCIDAKFDSKNRDHLNVSSLENFLSVEQMYERKVAELNQRIEALEKATMGNFPSIQTTANGDYRWNQETFWVAEPLRVVFNEYIEWRSDLLAAWQNERMDAEVMQGKVRSLQASLKLIEDYIKLIKENISLDDVINEPLSLQADSLVAESFQTKQSEYRAKLNGLMQDCVSYEYAKSELLQLKEDYPKERQLYERLDNLQKNLQEIKKKYPGFKIVLDFETKLKALINSNENPQARLVLVKAYNLKLKEINKISAKLSALFKEINDDPGLENISPELQKQYKSRQDHYKAALKDFDLANPKTRTLEEIRANYNKGAEFYTELDGLVKDFEAIQKKYPDYKIVCDFDIKLRALNDSKEILDKKSKLLEKYIQALPALKELSEEIDTLFNAIESPVDLSKLSPDLRDRFKKRQDKYRVAVKDFEPANSENRTLNGLCKNYDIEKEIYTRLNEISEIYRRFKANEAGSKGVVTDFIENYEQISQQLLKKSSFESRNIIKEQLTKLESVKENLQELQKAEKVEERLLEIKDTLIVIQKSIVAEEKRISSKPESQDREKRLRKLGEFKDAIESECSQLALNEEMIAQYKEAIIDGRGYNGAVIDKMASDAAQRIKDNVVDAALSKENLKDLSKANRNRFLTWIQKHILNPVANLFPDADKSAYTYRFFANKTEKNASSWKGTLLAKISEEAENPGQGIDVHQP